MLVAQHVRSARRARTRPVAAANASVARDSTSPFDPHCRDQLVELPGKIARLWTFISRTPAAANAACKRGPSVAVRPRRRPAAAARRRGAVAGFRSALGGGVRRQQVPDFRARARPLAQQGEGRPQPALQQPQPAARVVEGLRVGHGHAAAAGAAVAVAAPAWAKWPPSSRRYRSSLPPPSGTSQTVAEMTSGPRLGP